jgi:hypothetical protein
VQIDRNEFLLQSFNNIKVSPIGLVKNISARVMDFHDDLVDIAKVLSWESSEAGPLASLNVHFQDDMLLGEVTRVDDVLERSIPIHFRLLRLLAQALGRKEVVVRIRWTYRLDGVCAIVLVIGHNLAGGEVAAELIPPFNSEVDEGLCLAKEVGAQGIASVIMVPKPFQNTVCVLDVCLNTLNGFRKSYILDS